MPLLRKGIYSFSILLLLLLSIPIGAFAEDGGTPSGSLANLQTSLQPNKSPLKDKVGGQDFENPNDYPLVNAGQFIRTLTDSVGSHHDLTYNSTTSYSTAQMNVQIGYKSYSSYKDSYLDIEFFTNKSGTMSYLGSSSFYVGGFSSGSLSTHVDKSLYTKDPFIYMRIGVLASPYDTYYSDVVYFKVANPFYSGSTAPTGSNAYALVSNESTDGLQNESSGSFEINNDQYAFNKKIDQDAYKLDYVKPFDEQKYEKKVVNKHARSLRLLEKVGDSRLFWVSNLEMDQDYQLNATLLYSGTHSNVWVNNSQITAAQAAQLGKEFDGKIHQSDVDNFGNESDVDGNGKVNILCYDIQDGFTGSGGYVAGYFSPQDLYNVSYSNQSEIFYIDTYPLMGMGGTKDVSAAYSTLAHEFQHMINYNQKVFVQGHDNMDTWMDEGLAMAAEQIYEGSALQDRIDYYNYDSDIVNGHSLLDWDYYGDTLANYSLSYLFMQYLKDQSGLGSHVFKELINDPHSDYQAVEDIVRKYVSSNLTFGKFMTDFRAALLLKQDSGLYGFKGDQAFDSLKERLYSGGALSLQGGGAVVKAISSPDSYTIPVDKGADVTYTILKKADQTPPSKPTVNVVGDHDTVVTGKTEAKAKVTVKRGTTVIGTGTTDSSGAFKVSIATQKAGTVLSVYAADAAGNISSGTTITVSDKTAPGQPKVNAVSDAATSVSGTAEASASVTVKRGTTVIGSGKADSKGAFKVSIAKQKAGTMLSVYAEDAAHNKSATVTVKVVDRTAPGLPRVNGVSDAATSVSGTTEAYAKVTVKRGSTVIGTHSADSKGAFKVSIAKQKAGTVLSVYAEDGAHNKSATVTVKVLDRTAPGLPKVNAVSDAATSVSGTTEAYAKVTVKRGSTVIGTHSADSKGAFKVSIAKQKSGTVLSVYAEDAAHNKSATATVKVVDRTAPARPVVSTFGDNQTTISGKAEPGSTVTIKYGRTVLGHSIVTSKGTFSVKIAHKQRAGTTLMAYAKDRAGNQSSGKAFKVADKTAPGIPSANKVTYKSTSVSGKAEKDATVYLYRSSTYLGRATVSSKGYYSVKMHKQKKGTYLRLYAKDRVGNKSKYRYVKVY